MTRPNSPTHPARDPCDALAERVQDLTGSSSPRDPSLEALRLHTETCQPCAELLAQQQALETLLGSLPEAPAFRVPLPSLPQRPSVEVVARRRSRVFRLIPHAAAAAILAAAAVGSYMLPRSVTWETAELGESVRVERVVSRRGAPALQDERLVALTAGWEAVALRRPTERR